MIQIDEKDRSTLVLAAVGSLTLGLAPFFPEPHLFGKLQWIWGGGQGMAAMDYFDLVLHGAPWALLIYIVTKIVFKNQMKNVK